MIRSTSTLAALAAAAAVVLGACGGSSSTLTDPAEILTQAASATEDVTSFHVAVTLDGSLPAEATGGLPITLDGTNLAADVDVEHGSLAATLAIPALLGLSGELITVDGTVWVKTSFSGEDYIQLDATDLGGAAGDLPVDLGDVGDMGGAMDPAELGAQLQDFLDTSGLDPVKLDDVDCEAGTCYQVKLDMSADDLARLGGQAAGDIADLGQGSLSLSIRVAKDSLRFDGLDLTVDAGQEGNLGLHVQFSDWNGSLDIQPPPPDQVTQGDLGDILGIFGP